MNVEEKDIITVAEFQAWFTGYLSGLGNNSPTTDDLELISSMAHKVVEQNTYPQDDVVGHTWGDWGEPEESSNQWEIKTPGKFELNVPEDGDLVTFAPYDDAQCSMTEGSLFYNTDTNSIAIGTSAVTGTSNIAIGRADAVSGTCYGGYECSNFGANAYAPPQNEDAPKNKSVLLDKVRDKMQTKRDEIAGEQIIAEIRRRQKLEEGKK